MHKLIFALHLLFAVFAIGPLVHATTTASRGLRTRDAVAVAASARMARIYSYASIVVVLLGFGLLNHDDKFTQPWVWGSVLLWVVAMGLTTGLLIPSLESAGRSLEPGDPGAPTAAAGTDVASLVPRVAAAGGLVALAFTAIVFLMVYKPGQ
jgi:hypothetical protein